MGSTWSTWGKATLGLSASAGANVSCASHDCDAVYFICDQTRIVVESPGNVWASGTYALALSVDGAARQCTLQAPDPLTDGDMYGTCSAADVAWTLVQRCPQPPPVCDQTVCAATASSANCLPGQYSMAIVIASFSGPSPLPRVGAPVTMDLSFGSQSLVHATIAPNSMTTEPNGAGCGMCTNASASVTIASQ